MVVLEMADHGLDGSSASHLAANDFCDAADLAANPDPEPVGIVVAAIALVAVYSADSNTCSFSRSVMTGPSVCPSYGLPCSALAGGSLWSAARSCIADLPSRAAARPLWWGAIRMPTSSSALGGKSNSNGSAPNMKRTPSQSPAAWGSHPQRSHGEVCLHLFPHPPKLGGLPPGLRLSIVRLSDALTSLTSDALNITQPSVPRVTGKIPVGICICEPDCPLRARRSSPMRPALLASASASIW